MYNNKSAVQNTEDAILQSAEKRANKNWELPIKDFESAYELFKMSSYERKMTIDVVQKILKVYGISLRFNTMSYGIEISGLPEECGGEDAEDILTTLVYDWGVSHSFKKNNTSAVYETLKYIASKNRFHPVLERLGQSDWDGIDRLSAVYDILAIKDDFQKTLIRKWAIQTVAVLHNSKNNPVAAQGLLVLQGPQGIGKTNFFRKLAIEDRFFKGGATIDMKNKDTLMSATKVWICELGEIDNTTKKEQSSLKAFLTEQEDRFRAPYARSEVIRLRRTAFCGTVNPTSFLYDITGNRRFWTISVKSINLKKIFEYDSEWYAQFWRQIQAEYKENPKGYLLTSEEQEKLNQQNCDFEAQVFGEDEFYDAFDVDADRSKWVLTTKTEIAEVLNTKNPKLSIDAMRLGRTLIPKLEKTLGEFERKTIHGRRMIKVPPTRNSTGTQKTDYRHTEPPGSMVKIQAQQPDVEPMMFEPEAYDNVQF